MLLAVLILFHLLTSRKWTGACSIIKPYLTKCTILPTDHIRTNYMYCTCTRKIPGIWSTKSVAVWFKQEASCTLYYNRQVLPFYETQTYTNVHSRCYCPGFLLSFSLTKHRCNGSVITWTFRNCVYRVRQIDHAVLNKVHAWTERVTQGTLHGQGKKLDVMTNM